MWVGGGSRRVRCHTCNTPQDVNEAGVGSSAAKLFTHKILFVQLRTASQHSSSIVSTKFR